MLAIKQSKNFRMSSVNLQQHFNLLQECGLAHEPEQVLYEGKWDQHFIMNDKNFMRGSYGDVVAVKSLEKSDDELLALKLFRKGASVEEKTRIHILLQKSVNLKEIWPDTLLRYRKILKFSQKPHDALLMDYIKGNSMLQLIDNREIHEEAVWMYWLYDVLSALRFLHSIGIAHRDVHVGNVMITSDCTKAILVDLDLMCLPSENRECRKLCRGPAAVQATAPDIWCTEDTHNATQEQFYASDIWAAASTFVSYLLLQNEALSKRLKYTVRVSGKCKTMPPEFITQVVEKATVGISIAGVRQLVRSMLDAKWQKRPQASEARTKLEPFCKTNNRTSKIVTLKKERDIRASAPVQYFDYGDSQSQPTYL